MGVGRLECVDAVLIEASRCHGFSSYDPCCSRGEVRDRFRGLRPNQEEKRQRYVSTLEPKVRPWVWGFRQARGLRPEAWLQVGATGDGEAMASLAMIEAMSGVGEGVSDLAEDAVEELRRSAHDLIPDCVRTLAAWALSRAFGGELAMGAARRGFEAVGGELCPCGSGRTYERCCGSN